MGQLARDFRAAIRKGGEALPAGLGDLLGDAEGHLAGLRWIGLWHLSRGDAARAADATDRLLRLAPKSSIGLALNWVLQLAGRIPPSRLGAVTQAALAAPVPRLEIVLLIELLLACNQPSVARSLLVSLGEISDPAIAEIALRVIAALGGRAYGAVEMASDGRLTAWVHALEGGLEIRRLVLRQKGRAKVALGVRTAMCCPDVPRLRFARLQIDRELHRDGGPVQVVLTDAEGELELVGSPAAVPARASRGLEGGVWSVCRGVIKGWAFDPETPTKPLSVTVRDDAGYKTTVVADQPVSTLQAAGLGDGRHAFAAVLPAADEGRVVHVLHARTLAPLPGSPFIDSPTPMAVSRRRADAKRAIEPRRIVAPKLGDDPLPRRTTAGRAAPSRIVDVIVPAYRGVEETAACLASVLSSPCRQRMRIVVVDDASPEPALSEMLAVHARAGRIELLRNGSNLGFVGSVIRAMACHPARDAVILNADTIVGPGWLDRLLAPAAEDASVATVTPMSNNATICSYPRANAVNPMPDIDALRELDAACGRAGGVEEVPTGVGFCFFIRRRCWNELGGFDAVRFGRGYGEENDFCLRARERGWRNVVAGSVFVAHRGGVSFGADSSAAVPRAVRAVNALHPGYDGFIAEWIGRDPLLAMRRRLDVERLTARGGARRFLMIAADVIGGTERHIRYLGARLSEDGVETLVLKPAKPDSDGARVALALAGAGDFPNLTYSVARDWKVLIADLRRIGIAHIHYHHLLGLPDAVLALPKLVGCAFDVTVHDYSWVCRRINMMDERIAYCGEPDVAQCDICVRLNGATVDGPPDTHALRARSAKLFQGARSIFVPSEDAFGRVMRHFPGASVVLRRHEEPPAQAVAVRRPDPDGILRVAVVGAIGPHKGYDVLLGCARDIARRGLPIEFRLVGYSQDDATLIRTGAVWVTGRFDEDEGDRLLASERCHAAFLPSVWPETWCYALGTVLRCGLTPFVFDLGAMPERLRAIGLGVVLPLHLAPSVINDRLMAYRAAPMEARTIDLAGDRPHRLLSDYYGLSLQAPSRRSVAPRH